MACRNHRSDSTCAERLRLPPRHRHADEIGTVVDLVEARLVFTVVSFDRNEGQHVVAVYASLGPGGMPKWRK